MRTRTAAVLVPLVLIVCAGTSRAQLPHLDPMPHFTPADSTSRLAGIFEIDRNEDPEFGWSLNRFMATAILPAGSSAAWFLRLPVMTFDTGDVAVRQRWPWILGEEADEGWPNEKIVSGFGQIEVGVTGPMGFWFFEKWRYGVGLGLPTARNDIYPWAAGGMPFRFELRPGWDLHGGRYLWLRGGVVLHADATGNELDPTAFPDGFQLGAEFAWYLDRGRRWTVGYDYDNREGRRSQLVTLAAWFPWSDLASVGLRVRAELQGTLDRPALWYFTLGFRFDGRPAADSVGDQATDPPPK